MSLTMVTFDQVKQAIQSEDQGKKLFSGYTVAKGEGNEELMKEWLSILTPDKDAIFRGLNTKLTIDSELNLPIGLSIVTGGAGSGKTRWLDTAVVPNIPEEMDAHYLKFSEPGYYIPYSAKLLLTMIQSVAENSVTAKRPGALLIDSLMGTWTDPIVTKGFSTGRGGSSLGVPVLLQTIGQYALSRGFRVIAVLHPLFADPEVIENGISGVSSFFLNKDTDSYIIRDYEIVGSVADVNDVSLKYIRRERGSDRNGNFPLLVDTIGGED